MPQAGSSHGALPATLSQSMPQNVVPPYLSSSFFVLGVGVLLPWNAFLSSIDFYTLAFPTVPFGLFISLAYMLSMCAASIFFVVFPRRLSSYVGDILAGLSVFVAATLLLPALAPSAPAPGWFSPHLASVAAAVVCVGIASALTQSSLFAVAALFTHGECTKALNAGGGLAGVIVALLRMGSLLMPSRASAATAADSALASAKSSVYLFFISCACFCAVCIAELLWVSRSLPWREAMHDAQHPTSRDPYLRTRDTKSLDSRLTSVRAVITEVQEPFFAIVITFSVTIGLFPAVFTDIRGPQGAASNALLTPAWFLVTTVFLFSVGDWLGKSAPLGTLAPLLTTPSGVLSASVLRIMFCPITILAARGSLPLSDFAILAVVSLFGLTNGLITGAAFLLGPSMVADVSERDSAGKAMFLGLIFGMALGAAVGPLFKLLATPPG